MKRLDNELQRILDISRNNPDSRDVRACCIGLVKVLIMELGTDLGVNSKEYLNLHKSLTKLFEKQIG